MNNPAATSAPQGRIWVLGESIDTDAMAPGKYMKFGIDEIARHCLEELVPDFASGVRAGDVMVAGGNFGVGSSREQAPQALKHLGVAAVIASSFAGLFYRNAINLGLPVLVCHSTELLEDGQGVRIDLAASTLQLADGRWPMAARSPAFPCQTS